MCKEKIIKFKDNPIFPNIPGTWMEDQTANPDLLLIDDTYYMYFRAQQGGHDKIGVATIPKEQFDGIEGKGHFVGTYMAWGLNNNRWWGEGEIKFFIDGDKEFPTICGTGTEDYFCGSYNFENQKIHEYQDFTTPYAGIQVIRPDHLYKPQMRFGMYRWHITDPIRFKKDLKVTIQALGWRDSKRYLPLQDDIASVAFWYQTLPGKKFPKLPEKDYLEII